MCANISSLSRAMCVCHLKSLERQRRTWWSHVVASQAFLETVSYTAVESWKSVLPSGRDHAMAQDAKGLVPLLLDIILHCTQTVCCWPWCEHRGMWFPCHHKQFPAVKVLLPSPRALLPFFPSNAGELSHLLIPGFGVDTGRSHVSNNFWGFVPLKTLLSCI